MSIICSHPMRALFTKVLTPNTTTTENTRQGVANDDSVQSVGLTQSGVANAQSPDAGRETQDTTLNTRTRPGEGV